MGNSFSVFQGCTSRKKESSSKNKPATEETGHDPAVHGARLEDRFYNNDSFKSPSVDPSSPQQQDAALTIQTNYRKHAAEQEVNEMREDEAAQKIQAGFRGYQDRQKYEEIKGEEKKKEEEEVDIDLTDPDVEKAAVKIQAGFKGFKARQEIKETKEKSEISQSENTEAPKANEGEEEEEVDIDLDDPEVGAAALKIQAGFRGFQTRKEMNKQMEAKPEEPPKKEEEEVDIDLEDPEVANAALKIQAGFKGMKARQEIKEMKDAKTPETPAEKQEEKTEEKKEEKAEEVDIDLNDPETEKAALKIQAGFKGYQTRKEIKSKKDNAKPEEAPKEAEAEEKKDEEVDIDLNDPEVEKAATKIQAGFKGFKTRKELKDKVESESGDKGEESGDKQDSGDGTSEAPKQETEQPKEESEQAKAEEEPKTEGEEIDIDLNDPEVAKAATKIQAGFKGFKTRQDLNKKKEDDDSKE